MEPFFLTYLFLPFGYAGGLALISTLATRRLEEGKVEGAIRLFRLGTRAPLLETHRLLSRSNLMACYHALEQYERVEDEWEIIAAKLDRLVPFAGLPAASYAASLIAQGKYLEALEITALPPTLLGEEHREHPTALICEVVRLSNRATAYLLLGDLDRSQQMVSQASALPVSHAMLMGHVRMLSARLDLRRGELKAAAEQAGSLDFRDIGPLYRQEMELHRALILAQAGRPDLAQQAYEQAPDCLLNGRVRLLRLTVQAEVAAALDHDQRALSYYEDASRLGLPAGQCLLKAAGLAARLGRQELRMQFLQQILERDPQSGWARIASKRIGNPSIESSSNG